MANHSLIKNLGFGKFRKAREGTGSGGVSSAKSCRELIRGMALGFHPSAAGDLKAVYQFEVGGEESFAAHLAIDSGTCVCHDGPADKASAVIKTPAETWLKISRGGLNGRRAFMSGQYKVEGDLSLPLKLRALFPG